MGYSSSDILDRLRLALRLSTDTALAAKFGVKQNTVANWRKRNSVPWERVLDTAAENHLNLNWLLIGEGPRYVPPDHEAAFDIDLMAITLELMEIGKTETGSRAFEFSEQILEHYHRISDRYVELARDASLDRRTIVLILRYEHELPLLSIKT